MFHVEHKLSRRRELQTQLIIRAVLTLGMIYGAYTETGVWTACSLFLTALAIEGLVFQDDDKR